MDYFPLVSVFIPTYNAAEFIRECLDSVLMQDYPSMEIVISDDASTDNTAEILLEYKQKHPDLIKLNLNPSNVGITKNCNIILSQCQGKYIAMFAGDDVMLPGKITKQVHYMEQNSACTICYHDVDVFLTQNSEEKILYLHSHVAKPRQGRFEVLIKFGLFNAACATMVRFNKIPKHGFDERLSIVSDGLFWIDSLAQGGEMHYINEVLGRYRIHDKSATRSKLTEQVLDSLTRANILLLKYPQYEAYILKHYAGALFMLAKVSPKSIYYLRASFRVKKQIKTFAMIVLYYLTLGKLGLNSKNLFYVNKLFIGIRIFINKWLHS